MKNNRSPMILAQPHVSEESPAPATPEQTEPVIQRQLEPESADTGAPAVDIFRVAERVYQLMCEDLAAERIRRGLTKG